MGKRSNANGWRINAYLKKKRLGLDPACARIIDEMEVNQIITIPFEDTRLKSRYGRVVFYRNKTGNQTRKGRLFEFDNSPKLLNVDGKFTPVVTITRIR